VKKEEKQSNDQTKNKYKKKSMERPNLHSSMGYLFFSTIAPPQLHFPKHTNRTCRDPSQPNQPRRTHNARKIAGPKQTPKKRRKQPQKNHATSTSETHN
jgi:hypothetical protein